MWTTPMYNTTKLTVELRELVENGVNIWDFDYPSFYTGDDKKNFEKKVIDHYYFRQIGQETPGRFLHYFQSRIREIMPYYIRMYESVKLMDDLENPFDNVDVVEIFEEETTGHASGTSSETSSSESSDRSSSESSGSSSSESSGSSSSESSGTSSSESSGTSSSDSSGTESTTHNDTKQATDNKEHRFSNTPQGSITNLDSYITEASKDTDSSGETVEGSASGKSTSKSSGSSAENTTSESSGTSSSESSDSSSSESSGTTSSESSGTSSSESSGTSSSESSGTTKHTLTRKGNQGVNTYAHDIMEYRKSLIDVDMMIINNLQDLFLGVY